MSEGNFKVGMIRARRAKRQRQQHSEQSKQSERVNRTKVSKSKTYAYGHGGISSTKRQDLETAGGKGRAREGYDGTAAKDRTLRGAKTEQMAGMASFRNDKARKGSRAGRSEGSKDTRADQCNRRIDADTRRENREGAGKDGRRQGGRRAREQSGFRRRIRTRDRASKRTTRGGAEGFGAIANGVGSDAVRGIRKK